MKGTLLGFTFNNVHSSSLGLVRTSSGNEFVENLLPELDNKILNKPGSDGGYYFGSNFTQRTINLDLAFDGLTEKDLRKIKQLFGAKTLGNLVLDETPYKMYKVRISSAPSISYFAYSTEYSGISDDFSIAHNHYLNPKNTDEGEAQLENKFQTAQNKVLRGTMQISFNCYDPFAINRIIEKSNGEKVKIKYANQLIDSEGNGLAIIPEWKINEVGDESSSNVNYAVYNYHEWKDSVNLKTSTVGSVEIDKFNNNGFYVYNPGDLSTPFNLTIQFIPGASSVEAIYISVPALDKHFNLAPFSLKGGDIGIRINGKLHLIEGFNAAGEITGSIYNKYITNGDFFEIEPEKMQELTFIQITCNNEQVNSMKIDYDYRYL